MCRADSKILETGKTEDSSTQSPVKGRVVTQASACLAAALGNLSASAVSGWTASTLPSMKEDPDLAMNTTDMAWTVSIIGIACMTGSIFAGRAMDWWGRRTVLMATAPFLSAGWVTIALAPNTAIVLLGRFICGFTIAFVFCTLSLYCTEVSEARLRGRLGLIPSLFVTLGFVLSYMAGAFFSWRVSCYICLAPLIPMFIGLWVVPESPYWYLLKGRSKDCEDSLRWLRGPNYDLTSEINEMKAKLESVGQKLEYRELWRPRTRKPLLISIFMAISQQGGGANILMMYTGVIFISAGLEDHRLATLLTGLIQIVFTFFCVLSADHIGRRPLYIASTLISGIATINLGLYYLMTDVLGLGWPTWVPVVFVLSAVAGYCIGCRALPLLLASELFNTKIRSTARTVYLFHEQLLGFVISQVFPFFVEACGAHTVFFTFGGISLLCCLISVFAIPETKGKTLEQIQEEFEASSRKKKNANKVYPSDSV